jgi:hypothetical protein
MQGFGNVPKLNHAGYVKSMNACGLYVKAQIIRLRYRRIDSD